MSKRLLKGDRDELGQYVREMADLMGLRDWTIVMKPGNPEDADHMACAQQIYGQKHLNLWFRKDWSRWPAKQLRQTTCHELLHAHLNPLAHSTLNNVGQLIGKRPYQVAWEAMSERLEFTVDGIADAWSETLPLPVKAKGSKA